MTTKICKRCEIEKTIEDSFYLNNKTTCKKCISEKQLKYYKKHKEEYHLYYENKRVDKIKYQNKYNKYKYANDIKYKIIANIRTGLHSYIRKNDDTLKVNYGLSSINFNKWINFNKELDGLNICHLDHIRPIKSYEFNDKEDLLNKGVNHFSNIMPVSVEYNKGKAGREPTKEELFKTELRMKIFLKSIN